MCIHTDNSVYLVASPGACSLAKNRAVLTLPPAAGPDYFCAATAGGVLAYVTAPARCAARTQVPVQVAAHAHTPPRLAGVASAALPYTAGAGAVPVAAGLTVTSSDDTQGASATVRLGAGFAGRRDVLSFSAPSGISGSYDAARGELELSGTAPLASYQAALRSVTYRDQDAAAAAGPRAVTFQLSDTAASHRASNVVSRKVTVGAVPPVAADDAVTVNKNTAVDINVLANDSDRSGLPLQVAGAGTAATLGTVTVNPGGTVHYDPNGQFATLTARQTATDTFTYTASDGTQTSATATVTVTVTVTGADDAPVIAGAETAPLAYTASDPAVAVSGGLTVSDDDDDTVSGATAAITAGFDAADDGLTFPAGGSISGSYDSGDGVLTLTGDAAPAD